MSDTPKMIPLDEADFASLKHYAEVNLGLEVKTGTNGNQLKAKIRKANSAIEEIPVVEGDEQAPQPGDVVQVAPVRSTTSAQATSTAQPAPRAHQDPMHPNNDPKVELTIPATADKTRAKIADVMVNGVVWRIQRGERVAVPYRVFEALEHAKEMQAVETDEINPITGEPFKAWQEVLSYPYNVHRMPSDEEVAQWRERTSEGFQKAA